MIFADVDGLRRSIQLVLVVDKKETAVTFQVRT